MIRSIPNCLVASFYNLLEEVRFYKTVVKIRLTTGIKSAKLQKVISEFENDKSHPVEINVKLGHFHDRWMIFENRCTKYIVLIGRGFDLFDYSGQLADDGPVACRDGYVCVLRL